jgi:hypothetical protein
MMESKASEPQIKDVMGACQRKKQIDAIAGRFQLRQLEVELDRLLGFRAEALIRIILLRQILSWCEHAAEDRHFVAVVKCEFNMRPGLLRSATVT